MTEKRFVIVIDSNGRKSLWDFERTEKEALTVDDCCRLLNELYEENEQLKRLQDFDRKRILELEKDNEQLELYIDDAKYLHGLNYEAIKQKIERLKTSHASTLREFEKGTKKIQELTKENMKYREEIEILSEILATKRDTMEVYEKRIIELEEQMEQLK